MESEIRKLEEQVKTARENLEMAKKRLEGLRSGKPQIVAEVLHEKFCHWNHTDGCDWHYRDWNNLGHARKEWLEKAKKMILFCTDHSVKLEDAMELIAIIK